MTKKKELSAKLGSELEMFFVTQSPFIFRYIIMNGQIKYYCSFQRSTM